MRFPRGLARQLVQATAPRTFTQVARNPANSVEIGGNATVFAPAYGSPFVRDLEGGRRYGTIEDFRNFVKLAYASPYLHHSGGTVCEPVDLPVNKRHLDMVYAHLRYSDKPFMGSVTHPQRAEDTVEMARIVFGADFMEENTVILSLCNANSPLVWDATMLGAAKAYAEANQAVLMTPFILAGAMSPVTVAGAATQTYAEALAGMAYVQLVRPGVPVVLGSFASSLSMQSGAPTFGTPEPALVLYVMAALARRLGVPFRSGGAFTASKIPDAQAAYESANTMQPTFLGGVNFVLHAAGWLEGGLTMGYEKFVLDNDQCGMWHEFAKGVDTSENGQALDALLTNGPGQHYLGPRAHARELRDGLLPLSRLRQLELRAVGGRGRDRGGAARGADLEEDARGVRGAADRRRRRRGVARVDRAEESVLPGLGLLMDARASGHCLCGAVSFEVHGPLRDILLCHCEECRRWLGNVGSFSAAQKDDLTFLEDRGLRWISSREERSGRRARFLRRVRLEPLLAAGGQREDLHRSGNARPADRAQRRRPLVHAPRGRLGRAARRRSSEGLRALDDGGSMAMKPIRRDGGAARATPLRGDPPRRCRGSRARARADRGDGDGDDLSEERPRADARPGRESRRARLHRCPALGRAPRQGHGPSRRARRPPAGDGGDRRAGARGRRRGAGG